MNLPIRAAAPAKPGCSCQQKGEFNAEEAIQRLAERVQELGLLLDQYMSEAGLEREERVENAKVMSNMVQRIVGGVPAQEGQFPDCCAIGSATPSGRINWYCTGTLIHPRAVLTAAHCIDRFSPPNRVLLKGNNVDDSRGAEIIPVRRVVVHPNYFGSTDDLAILILRQASTVRPMPLATTAEMKQARKTLLVGFGFDDPVLPVGFGTKRMVEVGVSVMRTSPSQDLSEEELRFGFESDLEFVAGRKGLGRDTCNGDSGGPAYIRVGSGFRLAGVTSRATDERNSNCGDAGIYTRPDMNLGFIDETLRAANLTRDAVALDAAEDENGRPSRPNKKAPAAKTGRNGKPAGSKRARPAKR